MHDPSAELDLSSLHTLLERAGATVSTAESLTGGRLAALLTETPGASRTFMGGIVAYSVVAKTAMLGVPADLIEQHGAVSPACAEAMAERVRELSGSTYGLSTTGVAGPESQEGQPVGLVFVGLSGPLGTRSAGFTLMGSRSEIQDRSCREALLMMVADLREEETPVG